MNRWLILILLCVLSDAAVAGLLGCDAEDKCDQGKAYSLCMQHAQTFVAGTFVTPVCAGSGMYRATACQTPTICTTGPYNYYSYSSSCSSRPEIASSVWDGQLTTSGVCSEGCKMISDLDPSFNQTLTGADKSSLTLVLGKWVPTGDVCASDQLPSPPKPSDNCVSMGGNAKLCKADNGDTCISPNYAVTSSGTYCYQPGESGPKVGSDRRDGASLSVPNTPPNAPSNREGENFIKTGEASITNNITNTTYNSASYGNSGSANTGTATPGDGSGSDSGSGEGESEGSGSASGGGDCATPYVCSGDAVLCSVGQQVYLQRCGTSNGDADGDGQPDWTKVDGSDPGDIEGDSGELKAAHRGSVALGLSRLDDSGFLSGYRCPTFGTISTSWGSFKLDENGDFCNILKVARGALMLLGAFIALTILMGKGE